MQKFLQAYQRLGADGPYMKFLLPEAVTTQQKPLGWHVADAYALAWLEDDKCCQYRGAPLGKAEEEVFARVSAIAQRRLRGPLWALTQAALMQWPPRRMTSMETIHHGNVAGANVPVAIMTTAPDTPSRQAEFVEVEPLC
ncbi:hypothetical protein HPB52_013306 [Rhipicephalus sanguineus]|uniref:Uncharacterized protein n=1 Tax=Rhipicephalus sanguineus TaxID=34632 RepID=A0A9D4PNU6_RHISA|nr:hypothetical protein HPB52_013306 [Rhipicephalus sanguineus]